MYPKNVIQYLTQWIAENNNAAYNWLVENNYPELVAMAAALYEDDNNGDPPSLEWLKQKNKFILVAFVKSVRENKDAFKWLIANKQFIWAAVANAVNKDEGAKKWLLNNRFEHYAKLAEKIKEKFDKEDHSDLDFLIKGPIR